MGMNMKRAELSQDEVLVSMYIVRFLYNVAEQQAIAWWHVEVFLLTHRLAFSRAVSGGSPLYWYFCGHKLRSGH